MHETKTAAQQSLGLTMKKIRELQLYVAPHQEVLHMPRNTSRIRATEQGVTWVRLVYNFGCIDFVSPDVLSSDRDDPIGMSSIHNVLGML